LDWTTGVPLSLHLEVSLLTFFVLYLVTL